MPGWNRCATDAVATAGSPPNSAWPRPPWPRAASNCCPETTRRSASASPGRAQGARKKKPALTVQLVHLLRHDTAGDPCSDLRWTRRTARNLADYLTDVLQLPVSPRTVARLLRSLGYSLRVNHKCIPSSSPAERNEQFEFIDQLRRDYAARNTPILSIDKKICAAAYILASTDTTGSPRLGNCSPRPLMYTKTVDLLVRPIRHRKLDRVRARPFAVPAGVLRGMAPAAGLGAAAVRRRGLGGLAGAARPGRARQAAQEPASAEERAHNVGRFATAQLLNPTPGHGDALPPSMPLARRCGRAHARAIDRAERPPAAGA